MMRYESDVGGHFLRKHVNNFEGLNKVPTYLRRYVAAGKVHVWSKIYVLGT